jgi:hypothetical protein
MYHALTFVTGVVFGIAICWSFFVWAMKEVEDIVEEAEKIAARNASSSSAYSKQLVLADCSNSSSEGRGIDGIFGSGSAC